MGGVCGAAAIIKRKNIQLLPLMHGGGQEKGLRPGTENIPAIVGFGVAASKACELVSRFQAIQHLRDEMEDQLCNFAPQLKVYGQHVSRLPNTSCITMPNVSNELQLIALDLKGISVSAGAACSSGKVGSSHVLQAMGAQDAQNAIRVSLGLNSTRKEIQSFVEAWKWIYIKHHQVQVHTC
jgi:cysteine desulfurase